MRIVLVVTLWAICTCHVVARSRPRQKRTLRMLESLMERMGETFGSAPAVQRSLTSRPDLVFTSSRYPLGVKYMYYPTVRMHIRPVQPAPVTKHIIYMKQAPPPSPPPPPLTLLRSTVPKANVEIIRQIRPIMRLPKSKTTTTITYEIIPLALPVPPPSASVTSVFEHEDDESAVPWSMDALPPPVPTSKPTGEDELRDVPWNLQALPPPVATKRPRLQIESEWYSEQTQPNVNSAYLIPLVKKKLLIPAQGVHKLLYGHPARMVKPFRPSPLQSEISVQPSVEVAAYTEVEPTTDHHARNEEYFNRLNDRRPQTFDNGKERFRRDLRSSSRTEASTKNFSQNTYTPRGSLSASNGRRWTPVKPSSAFAFLPSIAYFSTKSRPFLQFTGPEDGAKKVENAGSESNNRGNDFGAVMIANKVSKQPLFGAPNSAITSGIVDATSGALDFGEFVDNEEADKADDVHAAYTQLRTSDTNSTNALVTVVRAEDWLAEGTGTKPDHYVAITPKPFNYVTKAPPELENSFLRQNFQNSKTNDDDAVGRLQRQLLGDAAISFLDSSKSTLRFPHTGLLSKSPRRRDDYRDPLSDLFAEPKRSKFAANADQGDFQRFDYDNIEYFEPIVIDIDKEKQNSDVESKLQFEYKNFDKKNIDEPLRLPDSLHETIDYLQKHLMHPPIFDLEGEANELGFVAVMDGNEIT